MNVVCVAVCFADCSEIGCFLLEWVNRATGKFRILIYPLELLVNIWRWTVNGTKG